MERSVKKGIKWQIIAAFILCAVFLLAGFALFTGERALADVDEEVDQTLSVSSGLVVHRGEEFDVDISIANNETGMHAMRLFVTYDRSAMTLVGYQAKNPEGNNWKGNFKAANVDVLGGYSTYGTANKPFVLLWDNSNKMYGNGVIVTLTFASDPNATIDPVTKKNDYNVNVAVDAPNTMMTYGKTCSPAVSGGAVEMRYGVYRVELLDANGDNYHYIEDNNNPNVSIQDVLDEMGGAIPQKAETAQFTFEFVSWREVASEEGGKHRTYKPTYRAIPKPYQLTLRQGIKKEGESEVDYGDTDPDLYAEITTYLGNDQYQYRDAEVALDYGTIIVFDDYKPTVDYARHPDYTFRGWYTDPACTQAVSFVTMPAAPTTLYGYYAFTADPDDVTTTKFEITTAVDGEYVIATLSVTENFGFNSLRFALDYDEDVLDFVGFLYESNTAFYGEVTPTFPVINDVIRYGGRTKNIWQGVEEGYTLEGKHFLFENPTGNAYSSSSVSATGKLISFKFVPKADAPAGATEIGITIGERDLTRYVGDGSTWYANAVVTAATPSILRVTMPTAHDDLNDPYVYTGSAQNYTFALAEDAAYFNIVANGSRTNRGVYNGENAVIVSLKSIENTFLTWEDGSTEDLSFTFTIAPKQVQKPAEYDGDAFVYDGTEKTYPVAYSDYYYVRNLENTEQPSNKRTLAGAQTVKVALTDDNNTEWADGTTADVTFDFVIHAKPVTPPTDTLLTYTYADGANVEYVFGSAGGSGDYVVANAIRVDAGNYNVQVQDDPMEAVRVTLKDAANTVWKDAAPGQETATLYYAFLIAKKPIAKPVAASVTYTYTGEAQTFLFTANETTYPAATTTYYTVANETRTNAGAYVSHVAEDPMEAVKVTLKDAANTEWDIEGTAEQKAAPQYFDFTIAKQQLIPLDLGDDLVYTGSVVKPTIELAEASPYEVYENNGGTSVGTYPVVFVIKAANVGNYEWKDPDDGHADRTTLNFRIVKELNNYWTVTPYVFNKEYDGEPISVTPAQALHSAEGEPVVTFYSGATKLDGAPSDAGSYTVNFKVDGTDDYNGLSVTHDFTISPKTVTKPTATTKTYVYNGEAQTYEFANPGDTEQYFVMIGEELTTTMTAAGSKLVEVYLKNPGNYVWKDGTISKIEIGNFVIQKKKVLPPTETTKTYVYTGDEQTYEFATAGDTEQYTLTGAKRTGAGSQTVTAAIKDKTNYVWKDTDTTADKTFTFTIARKQLTIPISAGRTYIYNGEEQDFRFSVAGDTERYDLYGDKQTEAGEYEVIARIKDNVNYEWTDGSTEDKVYPFSIRLASMTATTGGDEPFVVTIFAEGGFSAQSTFTAGKAMPNVRDLLEYIATHDKTGVLGALTAEEAAALVLNKCVVASLNLNLSPAEAGEYQIEIALPGARANLAVARITDDLVEVFRVTAEGETLYFTSDAIGAVLILADHVFDREVPSQDFLASAATCEDAAVYYKSCTCGLSSRDFGGETFVYGAPLGHDYDVANIVWNWNGDHTAATARLFCLRNGEHLLDIPATVVIAARLAPLAEESGYVDYVASITFESVIYSSDPYRVILPATGHVYSEPPAWFWKESAGTYLVKATFDCDLCDNEVTVDATVTSDVRADKIVYTAQVIFEGVIYQDVHEIERPVAIFDFNDQTTPERSVLAVPGDKIGFVDAPEREGYLFVGWRDENGNLIIKSTEGVYPDYFIGFGRVRFTAEWKSFATIDVSVEDTSGAAIEGATLKLYENEVLVKTAVTNAQGAAHFEKVPFGNYKLVAEVPYVGDAIITRSDGLDVDKAEISVSIVLPRSNFNTIVEGDGSAEGLENAIPESDRNAISDGTASGTINEIVITQKRVRTVDDALKEEIIAQVRLDDASGKREITDFYEVTIIKTTTARNATGIQYLREETIKVADQFQTNVFPLTAALRAKLAEVDGNAENVFVYKRHTYDTGVVLIYALPKVTEKEGKNAEEECFFIKTVAGVEYIAIRQKEYSVLAFGASADPILLANEITSLTLADRTYGDPAGVPIVKAKYNEAAAIYSYSASQTGEFVSTPPTDAGTYYVKAFIPATAMYGAAEKVVPFTIFKKQIAKPQADATLFVYDGTEKVYGIAASADYVITGARQTNAGTYVVTVTLADPANTVWDSGLDAPLTYEFVIGKKKLSEFSELIFKNKTFWFNGRRHSLAVEGQLPEGVTVEYIGNNEFDLGKFTVTAVFHTTDDNYDVSEPMTAIMTIRLNWIPIVILMVIVFTILVVAIVFVEKLLKRLKQEQSQSKNSGSNGKKAD